VNALRKLVHLIHRRQPNPAERPIDLDPDHARHRFTVGISGVDQILGERLQLLSGRATLAGHPLGDLLRLLPGGCGHAERQLVVGAPGVFLSHVLLLTRYRRTVPTAGKGRHCAQSNPGSRYKPRRSDTVRYRPFQRIKI
jgi:hypothetical protein